MSSTQTPKPAPARTARRERTATELHALYQKGESHGFKSLTREERAALLAPASYVTVFSAVGVLEAFLEASNEKNKERNAKIAALEARVAELLARPELKYCGVWEADHSYPAGSACTHKGGIWIAKCATSQRPDADGPGEHDWQLAVKRGADGRDLR